MSLKKKFSAWRADPGADVASALLASTGMPQPRAAQRVRAQCAGGLVALVTAVIALSGCAAGTRTGRFGPLAGDETLVTLVVSEDLAIVKRECLNVVTRTRLLGCQMSRVIEVPGLLDPVQTVKIVRYTDALPSKMAFEIDIHELCHAIAAVQGLDDPCHAHNHEVVHSFRSLRPPLPQAR